MIRSRLRKFDQIGLEMSVDGWIKIADDDDGWRHRSNLQASHRDRQIAIEPNNIFCIL